MVALGRPHLLPVDHPLIAVEHGRRLQAGQVGPGVRLAESLAPGHRPVEDLRQVLLLLLLGPPLQDRRSDQCVAEEVGTQGRLHPSELLGEDHPLHRRQPLAAVLDRPRGADPAAVEELLRPVVGERGPLVVGHLEAGLEPPVGQVLLQPRPDLDAELLGVGGIVQIHDFILTHGSRHRRIHPVPPGNIPFTRRNRPFTVPQQAGNTCCVGSRCSPGNDARAVKLWHTTPIYATPPQRRPRAPTGTRHRALLHPRPVRSATARCGSSTSIGWCASVPTKATFVLSAPGCAASAIGR